MHYSELQANLTEDEYNLVRHDYGRKCGEWSEADGTVEMTQELIDKLGVLEFETGSSPFDELPDQFAGGVFVAKVGEKLYLVNTEGFSYSRYIADVKMVQDLFNGKTKGANVGIEITITVNGKPITIM